MSDWQERITHDTAPAIRAEHALRYGTAAPLILASGTWADLGCGNGIAARAAFGQERPAHVVLLDVEQHVVATAARELDIPGARQLTGDLTDPATLERIGAALLELPGEPVITCFEVVEHLATFLPLLDWAGSLAREHRCTFLISVPNDAFWSMQNPHHLTSWGEGAFEELRRLLPADHTLLRQVALSGSALSDWESTLESHALDVAVGGDGTVATHFIAAFGPRHEQIRRSAVAVQTDMLAQRRWERERESDLALTQRQVIEQREELLKRTVWFEEWRKYIHELERELDRPLSGASEDELPEAADAGAPDPATAAEPAEPQA
jgi:SAM-dependent methyltransferase